MKNYEWIFSGIGVAILGIVAQLRKRKTEPEKLNSDNHINVVTNITNDLGNPNTPRLPTALKKSPEELTFIKASKRILFIDDDTKFKIVSILRKSGWKNVTIMKDVAGLHVDEIIAANIIFVDIQGVGKKLGFKDEGLGLVKALKESYPDKKVVIYSAISDWDAFQEGFRVADDRLKKNAEFYEFEKTITELLT